MEFLGAKEDEGIGYQKAEFKHNYFIGSDESKWRSGVEPARALKYNGLYDNAYLDFYTKDGQLKYDWHISEPAALQNISWRYNGATSVEIHPEGHLIVNTSVGHFYESNPISWGWKDGERVDFGSWYELYQGTISFGVEAIAYTLDSLVIDPQLIYLFQRIIN